MKLKTKQLVRDQSHRLQCICPVKQKRALLKSNSPRDSWIEGDEIKNVSIFGEVTTSSKINRQTFISEPSHALKTWAWGQNASKSYNSKKQLKTSVNATPFFRSKPKSFRTGTIRK
jgi:hypothetical protein